MCIKVFKKEINMYYRGICLLSFVTVIMFSNNIVTYIILGIMFALINLRKQNMTLYISLIITLIVLLVNNLLLIKIILCIDYILYFILFEEKEIKKKDVYFESVYKDNQKKISSILEKGEIDSKIKNDIYNKTVSDVRKKNENKLLRFNSSDYSYYDTRPNYYYVIFHLIILFLSILIGSCVI